ncbi:MAG: UrcA family protein [Pseudomonadota bacterium]|mgnify:CR=1 FL=1
MRKTFVTLIAAAAVAAPFAHAEGTPITVEMTYDATLLATEAGAKSVLDSLKVQAAEACSYATPVTGTPTFDRDCRDDLVDKAIGEIRLAALEEGQAATYVFAALDSEIAASAQ